MEKEIWKDIPGFEEDYQASSLGRIRSKDRKRGNRFYQSQIKATRMEKDGYLTVNLSSNGVLSTHKVHRLIMKTFIGEVDALTQVNHKDGDKTNNILSNLEYTTPQENSSHRSRVLNPTCHLICENLETGEIREFSSINECRVEMGFSHSGIRYALKNNTIYKRKWKFLIDNKIK